MDELSFGKILLLVVIVLLVFGAKRLPEIGSSLGKGIREFKSSLSGTQDALMKQPPVDEQQRMSAPQRILEDDKIATRSGGDPKRLSQ